MHPVLQLVARFCPCHQLLTLVDDVHSRCVTKDWAHDECITNNQKAAGANFELQRPRACTSPLPFQLQHRMDCACWCTAVTEVRLNWQDDICSNKRTESVRVIVTVVRWEVMILNTSPQGSSGHSSLKCTANQFADETYQWLSAMKSSSSSLPASTQQRLLIPSFYLPDNIWDPYSVSCSDRPLMVSTNSSNSSPSKAKSDFTNWSRWRMTNFRCFTRFSYAVAIKSQRLQCFVRVLQSYSFLCTEKSRVMSRSLKSMIIVLS